jgi:hypothetical protein
MSILSSCMWIQWYYLKLFHSCLLLHPFQFAVLHSYYRLRYRQHHWYIINNLFQEVKGLNCNKKVKKHQMYPKHTSRLWMFDSYGRIPFWTLTTTRWSEWYDLSSDWWVSTKANWSSLHSVWICHVNVRSVMTGREIKLGEETFSCTLCMFVESSWNLMAHGNAREEKWRGNWLMEWVASTSSYYLGTWCIQHYYRWCAHLSCQ